MEPCLYWPHFLRPPPPVSVYHYLHCWEVVGNAWPWGQKASVSHLPIIILTILLLSVHLPPLSSHACACKMAWGTWPAISWASPFLINSWLFLAIWYLRVC